MGEETDVSGRIPGNSQGGNPQDPESLLPSPNIGDGLLDDWTLHLNQVQPPSLSLTPANTATNQQPYHNNFSNPDSLQTSRVFRPTQLSTSDTIRQPSLKFPLSGGLRNDLSDSKATKDPMANDTPLGPRLLAQSVPRPFSRSDSNGVMERSSPRTRRTSNPNPSKTKGHHSRRHSRTHSEVLRDDTNGARQAAYPTSHRISLPLTPKGVTGFNEVASPPTSRSTSLPRLKPTASDRRAAAGALPEPSSIRPVPLPSSLKHPQRASPHISEDQIWHAIGKRKDRVDHDNTGGPAEVVDAALPRSILKSTTSTLGSANEATSSRKSKRIRLSLTSRPTTSTEGRSSSPRPSTSLASHLRILHEGESANNPPSGSTDNAGQPISSPSQTSVPLSGRVPVPPPSAYAPSMSSRRGGRRGSISSQISARSSIPIRAFTSPHPPSIAGSHKTEYRLRDPYLVVHGGRNSRGRDLDTMSRYSRANRKWWRTLPPHGWCFFIGFIFPPVWWVASFTDPRHIVVSRMKDNGLIEEWNESDKEALTWRFRCRLSSILTLILYIPVVVLAIVFGR